ncbi:MAG: HAMP domain-containing histidine kinase, partial [Actinomycetota bacterium]|nr:HAMP domain-containing histidine kinase [Actinomycetota bacterium]
MKRRLSMIVLSVTLVAVLGFGLPLGIAVRRLYRNEAVLRLERAAASSAIQVPATFRNQRDPVELPQQHDGTHVALFGPDGMRVAGVGPARADPIVLTAVAGRASTGNSAGDMIAAMPLTSNERVYAVLRAAVPGSTVEARVHRAWAAMAGIADAALLLAAIVAWRQTRRMVRPVQELAEAADRLGAGDFSVRPRTTGIAELDTVALALGRTAERLGRMVGRERTFSEDASHQLRSPLTGLRLRLETAMETPSLSREELLEGSLADVERLDATVAALLTLAREPNPGRTTLDVRWLLHDVEEAWHGRLAADGRRLRVRFVGPPADVEASGAAMRQVLDVLV